MQDRVEAGSEVIGRASELGSVADFLESIPVGSVALLIEGEAGIGKTTIWNEALRMAAERSARVISCRPSGSEAKLSYAALTDLLDGSVSEVLPVLPEPQRLALEVALLRSLPGGSAPDQRTVSAATLGVVRRLAKEGPLVIGVDDVQWLDASTARVLEFALRRLDTEPISFVASVRRGAESEASLWIDRALANDRIRRLPVGSVDVQSLSRIISSHLGATFPPPTLRRLHRPVGATPCSAWRSPARSIEIGPPPPWVRRSPCRTIWPNSFGAGSKPWGRRPER
jgi:AAA ATPase domain